MTDTTEEVTMDWNRFWTTADDADREGATASSSHAREVLAEFLAARGAPDSLADVGCGPGLVAFDVADRYPDADVVGYDTARSVIEENRERAREEGTGNIRFEQATLPAFDPSREFDVVFCYATLGYVVEAERAVEALYETVAPGGCLVVTYANRLSRGHYRSVAEGPKETLADTPGFDPDRYTKRFGPVIEGENLLSYECIHELLGTWPQSVFSVVDRPEIQWAWRHHPLVYVPKR